MDTNDAEVKSIADALDELLRAYDTAPPSNKPDRAWTGTEMGEEWNRRAQLSEAQRLAEDICARPIGHALRRSIQDLGRRLHEIGGINVMQQVLHEVAERDQAREGWRIGVMDKRWDGIGNWAS